MTERDFDSSPHTRIETLRLVLAWPVAKRSLIIMVIVGSVLNVINQGDMMFAGGAVNWWKVVLTYCVPFCVATYGAFCAFRTLERGRADPQPNVLMRPDDEQAGIADGSTVPSCSRWREKDKRQ